MIWLGLNSISVTRRVHLPFGAARFALGFVTQMTVWVLGQTPATALTSSVLRAEACAACAPAACNDTRCYRSGAAISFRRFRHNTRVFLAVLGNASVSPERCHVRVMSARVCVSVCVRDVYGCLSVCVARVYPGRGGGGGNRVMFPKTYFLTLLL